MILSFGIILLGGFIIGYLLNKIKIPGLVGMLLFGLFIGPQFLNLIDKSVLSISSELRQIALVIILTRSGLNLDFNSLKKIGRPAILLCFIPATVEIIGVTIASIYLLNLSIFESLLLGSVLAAVSPAVVSPRMIELIERKEGEEHQVPKLILAGASVDDIYVVVLFYSFLGLVENDVIDIKGISMVPVSIILGILLGILIGFLLSFIYKKLKTPLLTNVIITLAMSFLFIGLENYLKKWISISSLLSIMVMSMILLFKNEEQAKELSKGYNVLWKVFEIILFVLVGASIDFHFSLKTGLLALIVLMIGLAFRCIGVLLSLLGTSLTWKERGFVILSYLPKATVQASIGGIALSLGLSCGSTILMVSVLAILITAPIGAILIDHLHQRLLKSNLN